MKKNKKTVIIKVRGKDTTNEKDLHIIKENEVMNFKNEQEKFDVIKWYDSIVAGEDRCGSYDFCASCNKAESEPCARAAFRSRPDYVADESVVEEPKNVTPVAVVRLRRKVR